MTSHIIITILSSVSISHRSHVPQTASNARTELVNVSFVDRSTLVLSCVGVLRRTTSLTTSSFLHQQCPACLACPTLMVCQMGGKWPYSCYFVGCCFVDLFKTARKIIILFVSSFFSNRFVRIQVVQPYSSTLLFYFLRLVTMTTEVSEHG